MNVSRRYGVGLALAMVAALAGLVGCGQPDPGATDVEYTELSWEGQALETIGMSPAELPAAAAQSVPTASPGPGDRERNRRWRRVHFPFRNVLHAEGVVQTDEGQKTVVVQRGSVTAISATSMTVRSADGFTLVWTLGDDKLRVFERRNQVQPSAVAVGADVGVAGAKEGDAAVARLLVIRRPR
jgi:hypothetical protein